MSELKPQWIIDQISANELEIIARKWKIAELKAELNEHPLVKQIEALELSLREYSNADVEMRSHMKESMMKLGMKKFEALDGTVVQLNKKPWKLIIEDKDKVPDEYKKEKVTVSIDNKSLKEDIKEGVIIDGVSISEDYSLVIKR